MVELFGKKYEKEELLRRTGTLDQILGIKEYSYNSGRAKNVDAIEINSGDLTFTVFPSRCLDIGQTYYRGIPLAYISKSGLRAPDYFVENKAKGFLDSFYGGLLTTSGLNNIGTNCSLDAREYGVHGEVANIPAEKVCKKEYWEDGKLYLEVSGEIRHSRFYAEDLVMERTIRSEVGSNKLIIKDSITNMDFKRIPVMLLYHLNLGFPLLDSSSALLLHGLDRSWPRTESARAGLATFDTFSIPIDNAEEECFYHSFKQDTAAICLYNPSLGNKGIGLYLMYDIKQLPVFLQWKMMRSKEYVCGFAPATNFAEGRADAQEKGNTLFIEPMEKIDFEMEIGVVEDLKDVPLRL